MVHKQRRRAVIALTVLAMVAGACGSDDEGGSSGGGSDGTSAVTQAASEDTAAAEDTAATEGTAATEDTATEGTGGSETTTGGSTATSEAAGSSGGPSVTDRELPPGEQHVEEDEGEPVQGGDLIYGIEADSANPWAPYRTSTATSGYVMMTSVADPLFTASATGEIAPVLVESFDHNEDYTQWTFTMREGMKFHDGTPIDGAAVAFNIKSCQYSALTGSAFTWIKDATGEGQTVTIDTNRPYVLAPRQFTERQCAYMFSPTWLGTLADIPQRNEKLPIYDAGLAATPANGDPSKPVGSGAFVFQSYAPGNGNSFKLVRNDDYWRGPNGVTGENLPHLDSIEGVVAVDIDGRSNALRSGQFDVMHTSNADAISQFRDDDEFETIATSLYGDTGYIMLNHAAGDNDPEGKNANSPLLNVHCRRALAHATDVDRVVEERGAGLSMKANGPFGPGVLGHLDDTGYPSYDPDKAVEEFDTCLSELGTDSIEFTFNTTNDPFNVETNTLIISMWQEVLGDAVQATITPIEQGQYIGLALTGAFEAFGWTNHGGIDPATQAYWWQSSSASPVGSLALNFGRITDAGIDAGLKTLETEADPGTRRQAAEQVNRIFGEQVYNIWLTWALWGVIEHPYVNGTETNALPDGGEGIGLAFSGRHQTNQIWCDGGVCE